MSKKEAKPMYVPQKEDVVSGDRTAHRSSAWQYFQWDTYEGSKFILGCVLEVLQMGIKT